MVTGVLGVQDFFENNQRGKVCKLRIALDTLSLPNAHSYTIA